MVLTKDDLVAAEVTEVDKLITESPEKACEDGEILLVPDNDGALIIVGEDSDTEPHTQETMPSQDNALPPPEVVSSGEQSKGQRASDAQPTEDEGEYVEDIEIVNHRVEISEMTRMRITRKKKPGANSVDAQDFSQEPIPPEKPK